MPFDSSSPSRRLRRAARFLALACVAASLGGCADFFKNIGDYLNLRNSLLSPNEVGRFDKDNPWGNVRVVHQPILEQLDVLDEPKDKLSMAQDPTPTDLIPQTRENLIGPGDEVRITVYELVQQQQDYVRDAQVSETGFITLPNLGSINIAGRTTRQAEEEIAQIGIEMRRLPAPSENPPRPGPQITVSVIQSRANTFTALGAVSLPGTYFIQGPDFRLLDALGLARDVSPNQGVDTIYVIRHAPRAIPATSEQPLPWSPPGTPAGTTPPGPQKSPLDALDTIEKPPATQPVPAPSVVPGAGASLNDSNKPRYVRQLTASDVTNALGAPPGAISQADLDAAIEGTSHPATAPAANPAAPDMMDQALGAAGTQAVVGGKTVNVEAPATMPIGSAGTGPTAGPPSADAVNAAEAMATQRVIRIPLDQLRAGVARYNIVIRAGDVIEANAPEASYFYMLGHVNKPGAYTLTGQHITLKEAVAAAGNLDSLAIPRRCELWRRIGTNHEAVVQVNLQKIFDGTEPDLFLKRDDLVNIGTDVMAPILAVTRNAYRLSYGFGFVYDRNYYIQPQKISN